jgi:raffinose/stachyose/melibiose transport system substrate-binding protein
MLSDLFGSANSQGVLAGLKAAGWDDFKAFCDTVDAYIKNGTAGTVSLNGKSFKLAAQKTGRAKNLKAIFAMAGSQTWTYGDHLVNIPIDCVFPTVAAAMAATPAQLDKLKGPFLAYAKTLEYMSSHSTSPRGPEFVNSTTNSYDAEVANFCSGKTLFVQQGDWVYTNMQKANPAIVDTLDIIPLKMPIQQSDIQAPGLTVQKINQSLTVWPPDYYLINQKLPVKVQQMAEKFLVWLNTTPAGQKFVIEDMAFIPYNADPKTTKISMSLGKAIISYMADGNTIPAAYSGAPAGWTANTFGQKMMESYLTKAAWTDQDLEDIANFAVSSWKQALAGSN